MNGDRITYRFGPLERRGVFGAVRPAQALIIAVGALISIGVLDQLPSALGALTATAVFGCAAVLALAPIGRRTAQEWGRSPPASSVAALSAAPGSAPQLRSPARHAPSRPRRRAR